jgi:hypothetical protein
MALTPGDFGTGGKARAREERIRAQAARRQMVAEAKRDRDDGEAKPPSFLSRVLARLRGNDR